jgi:hypothetical protein
MKAAQLRQVENRPLALWNALTRAGVIVPNPPAPPRPVCACGQPAIGYAVPPPPASQHRGIPACRQFAADLVGRWRGLWGWHLEPLDADLLPFRSIAGGKP